MKKFFICSSIGNGKYELTSFDSALKNSNLANYNLVKVSSILPANIQKQKSVDIAEGSVLYTAFAHKTTNKSGEIVSAAIAVGIPIDKTKIGVIMEFSGNCSMLDAEKQVHTMVKEAMENRGYEIEKILSSVKEVCCDGKCFVTAFAALAMW